MTKIRTEFQLNTEIIENWLASNKPFAVEKLAKLSGVSEPEIYRLRTRTRGPTNRNLNALAGALGVEVPDLIQFVKVRSKTA